MSEELKSELLFHASQSKIPQELKDAIASNLEKIPEDKASELLRIFEEEKEFNKK